MLYRSGMFQRCAELHGIAGNLRYQLGESRVGRHVHGRPQIGMRTLEQLFVLAVAPQREHRVDRSGEVDLAHNVSGQETGRGRTHRPLE